MPAYQPSEAEADGEKLNAAVFVEQIGMLVRMRIDLAINLINANIAFAMLGRFFPNWLAMAWLGTFWLVILARHIARHLYQIGPPDADRTRRWAPIFVLNACATGCLWGMVGATVLLTPSPDYQIFVVLALDGMMAGGVVTNSAYLPALVAFMIPTILPLIAILLSRPEASQIAIGVMGVFFMIVMLAIGRSINRSIIESFRLRFQQGMLLAKLRSSERAMAETQRAAHVGGVEFGIGNEEMHFSAEAARIFGIDPHASAQTFETMIARVHADDRRTVRSIFTEPSKVASDNEFDCRIVMDDGTIKVLHVGRHKPADPVDGYDWRSGLFATVQDITERTRTEAARTWLATIVDSSDDAIISETITGVVISWNRGAERLFGYSAAEAIGKNIAMIVPEDRRAEFERHLQTLGLGNPVEPFDTSRLRKDGTLVPVSIAVSLNPASGGQPNGVSFIARDITERQTAADALRYRDHLFRAIAIGTGILVKSNSLEIGMPQALRMVGESLGVDAIIVIMHDPRDPSPGILPAVRYIWQAEDVKMRVAIPTLFDAADKDADYVAWRAPLLNHEPIYAQIESSKGLLHTMLEHRDVQSLVVVPVFVGETLWGSLSAESCQRVRNWMPSETDILTIFGEIVGSLIDNAETAQSLERSEARFRAVTAAAQDAIVMIDEHALISVWNPAAERLLGYGAQEAMGQQMHALIAPKAYLATAAAGMAGFADTGLGAIVGKTTEFPAIRKDGKEIAIELSLASAHLGLGWGAVAILRDITARKEAQEKLVFANVLLKTQMEASLDGILIVDAAHKIIAFNHRLAEIWNFPLQDLATGEDGPVLSNVAAHFKDQPKFRARVQYLYDHPDENGQEDLETIDGRTLERYTVSLHLPDGKYLGRIWIFRDITERKAAAANALRMARFDVLTGLANRAVFVEAVERAIAAAKRGEKGFAIIYLDLDHFKDVNDTQGHPVGDELLQMVATLLLSNTRKTDTVARFGGDEFAVIVAAISTPADAANLADKLIDAFAAPFRVDGRDIHTSASIGISVYKNDSTDTETLLSQADVALYRAKSEQRGSYSFFTKEMDIEVQSRVKLGSELRIAIDSDQLFLLYQPQVDINDGQIDGVEALVRWRHPERGVLGPDLFIPVAEQIGVIGKLGHWVLWEACRQAKRWLDAGIPPVRMAVNVSALQFKAPLALEEDIAKVLRVTGLPPRLLELELTESVLMDITREHLDVLQRLRNSGITTAIDDFGTGYSSLDYLRRFPSTRIKIAQNFVKNLHTSADSAAIVRATISLAHELGIDVIAEGIETTEQAELLKSWGCGEVQGFLYSAPLTAQQATRVLRKGELVAHAPDSQEHPEQTFPA